MVRKHRESGQTAAPVRLMTYNIHRWAGRDHRIDLDRLAAVIRETDADIVGLNEVLHPVTDSGHTYAPLIELAEKLHMGYAFGPSGWSDYGPAWSGPVGNAILSRYPLAEVSNTWLPRLPGSKQRSLLGATVASGPVAGLNAFVTHLDHAFEGTRLLQIQGVLDRIAQDAPHFLVGDFNTPGFVGPSTRRLLPPVLRMMRKAGYQDAFHAVGEGSGRTFPSHSPLVRIDFLFLPYRYALGLRSAQAVAHGPTHDASDHRPLLVEWEWPQPEHSAALAA
jgi:endonuclease/exonuclease/phosphatase family metal-dependent hydrolase